MRIGIFTDSYKPLINGVVTSIYTLEQELTNNGHEVFIITTGHKDVVVDEHENIIRIKGTNVIFKSFEGFQWVFNTNKYIKDIKELNLDLIHIHTEFTIGYLGLKCVNKLNIPSVYTYHTMYQDYAHHIPFFGKLFLKNYLIKFFIWYVGKYVRSCDRVIVPSTKAKHELEVYDNDDKISVIPTGIDLSKFNSTNYSDSDINDLKVKLNIKDELVFSFVGRVAKEKSIDELLNALNNCHVDNYKLLLVGDGPEMNHIKALINELNIKDKVILTGLVSNDEIGLYYQLADVFLNASSTESQGLTYIEALSSSLPVIVKNDENLIDTVINYENGLLYEENETMCVKIDELTSNKALFNKLKLNSKKSVKKYSKENFYNSIIKLYNEIQK